jgi:hypothetical protein
MSKDKPQSKNWSRRNWVAKHAPSYNKASVQEVKTKPQRKPKNQRPLHELDPDNYEDWDNEGY